MFGARDDPTAHESRGLMRIQRIPRFLCVLTLFTMSAPAAAQLHVGQRDTFEDGTTQNWATALLGVLNPVPPLNISTGGPGGVDDNYLLLRAIGGSGAGSRLTVINFGGQWAGDYLSLGITAIMFDAINLGSTPLSLRLLFE